MQRLFKISVNGKEYDVAVDELTSGTSQLMPSYTGAAPVNAPIGFAAPTTATTPTSVARAKAGTGDQCAQMGGVVAAILVKVGQGVSEGDRVAELEAMKMKVPVMANCSGKVSRILVSVGDGVESGQVLLNIE